MLRTNCIRTPVNRVNYTAIDLLENLDIDRPSQKQIDLVEALILLAINPRLPDLKKIEASISKENAIVRQVFANLFRQTRRRSARFSKRRRIIEARK